MNKIRIGERGERIFIFLTLIMAMMGVWGWIKFSRQPLIFDSGKVFLSMIPFCVISMIRTIFLEYLPDGILTSTKDEGFEMVGIKIFRLFFISLATAFFLGYGYFYWMVLIMGLFFLGIRLVIQFFEYLFLDASKKDIESILKKDSINTFKL